MSSLPGLKSFWGKLATATYIVTSVVVMYYNFRREQALIVDLFIWAALAVTLISAIDYFIRLRRLINEPETGPVSRV